MTILVGYTGFVGSNLYEQYSFDKVFNSKNIKDAFGTNPDLLVYSGVPAQKFLANQNPEQDFETIKNAIENIKRINPKKIVLISTIDVYKTPINVDEDTEIIPEDLEAYGKNRYYLGAWVKDNFEDYLIVHLPGLYGRNIKKNFIYDLIKIIPSMLKEEKFKEITEQDHYIVPYYEKLDNGFYKCKTLTKEENDQLIDYFNHLGFSALNFTDSRGTYQFYNLSYLWEHIQIALSHQIKELNLATEPVMISELYQYIMGTPFHNEISSNVAKYDFHTKHDHYFNGKNGYIFDKEFILEDIRQFVEKEKSPISLAISNIAWTREMDPEVFKLLQKYHIHGLEIAPTRIVETAPYENIGQATEIVKRLKEDYQLQVVSMQSIWFGKTEKIFESEEEFNEMLNYTYKAIDFAHAIHCPNLVFGCPRNRVITNYEEDYKKALLFFQKVGLYAQEKGVTIAIEPNPTIYHTNFLNYTAEALEFVKDVNLESVKINYDLGTVITNQESLDILGENISYINHIHISEANLELITPRELHKQLFSLIRSLHYSKSVSIEMKTTNSIDDIEKTLKYVRSL